jgi:hypothetical protein
MKVTWYTSYNINTRFNSSGIENIPDFDYFDTQKIEGLEATRKLPKAADSKIVFPASPETRAANLPTTPVSIQDIVDKNISAELYRREDTEHISHIVAYPKVNKREYGCLNLTTGDTVAFGDTSTWITFTYQGTGTIVLSGNNLECTASGTVYDIKVFDANGTMLRWYPCCEHSGIFIYDVMSDIVVVATNKNTTDYFTTGTTNGVIQNYDINKWTTQNSFDYIGTYGGNYNMILVDFDNNFTSNFINEYNEEVISTPDKRISDLGQTATNNGNHIYLSNFIALENNRTFRYFFEPSVLSIFNTIAKNGRTFKVRVHLKCVVKNLDANAVSLPLFANNNPFINLLPTLDTLNGEIEDEWVLASVGLSGGAVYTVQLRFGFNTGTGNEYELYKIYYEDLTQIPARYINPYTLSNVDVEGNPIMKPLPLNKDINRKALSYTQNL